MSGGKFGNDKFDCTPEFAREGIKEVDYDNLVENIKRLLEVIEAPRLDSYGDAGIILKERAQYFKAKDAICEIIFKA